MAKQPTPLTLDRLDTPIGIALLVTNHGGALCALDWIDYEERLLTLLRRYYGTVELTENSAPSEIRSALSRYFDGDLDQLDGITCHIPGTPFQNRIWTALRKIPAGSTLSYGTLAAQLGDARRRPCQWCKSPECGRALPSADRRQRITHRLWRRHRPQTLAAGT